MAHHKYRAEGIILNASPSGESDREFFLYTKEFGLINARARSIREERSRLRYTFQPFTRISLELLRGKQGWKIASGTLEEQYLKAGVSPKKMQVVTQYVLLVSRLIKGEEPHREVFELSTQLFIILEQLTTDEMINGFELVGALRLLALLGYWGEQKEFTPFLSDALSPGLFEEAEQHRKAIVPAINNALRMSQL